MPVSRSVRSFDGSPCTSASSPGAGGGRWRPAALLARAAMTAAVVALAACNSPMPAGVAVAGSATPTVGKVEVLWLGQSAMRIRTPGGKVIMVDPWLLANPKTPLQYKNLDAVGKIDLILVTHAHGDHYADAPALAQKNNVPVYGPAGLNQVMVTLGILPQTLSPRMSKGGTITPFPGVRITEVHAEHSSELLWRNPATGKDETQPGGEPVGFIIQLENGFTIYHMGDTAVFGDMRMIGERYHPDLVMVPIGGHFVMNPQDAGYAVSTLIKPRFAIPMHYGTIPQLAGTPEEFVRATDPSVKISVMQPGDTLEF